MHWQSSDERPRGLKNGFTFIEAVVGLLVGITILLGAWSLMEVTAKQRHLLQERTDVHSEGQHVDLVLRRALHDAGSGLPKTWNISSVHAAPQADTSTGRDTLTVLRAEDATSFQVATQACTVSGACIRLLGDASSLAQGSLLLVGSPRTGGMIVQVTSVSAPYQAACGSDCSETMTCTDASSGTVTRSVVTASTTYDSDGNVVSTATSPCEQSYFPDGSRCEETITPTALGNALYQSCSPGSSANSQYTDVRYTDRTSTFGFPTTASAVSRSGAFGIPLIQAYPLTFERYWLQGTDHPGLVRSDSLATDGSFANVLPVARDVTSLRFFVQHRGESALRRGVQVSSADLSHTGSNVNFLHADSATATSSLWGYDFTRSYRSIELVRAVFDVTSWRDDGTPETRRFSSTTPVSGAGDP